MTELGGFGSQGQAGVRSVDDGGGGEDGFVDVVAVVDACS